MALDPRIALGVQPLQIESPINTMAQIAQLRASQQQEQFNAMRLAQAQREQQEADQYNALMARGGATPQELIGTPQGRAALKSVGEAYQLQQAGEKERRLAEASRFELGLKQKTAIVDALRPLAGLPPEQLTREVIAAQLAPLPQFGVPQPLIDQTIAQISDNPMENKRSIDIALRAGMSAQQQAAHTAPILKTVSIGGKDLLMDENPNSPTFNQTMRITPSSRVLSAGQMQLEGGQVVAQAPFAPRPEPAAPAPSVTEIVDPNDPTRMIKIDARTGQTLGVSGKSPEAAKAAAKEEAAQAKAEVARQQLTSVLNDLKANYEQLDRARAIPSTERGVVSNILSATAATGPGQVAGRFFGTEEQVYRDAIGSARNILLNAVKNATGMSAQQLNSNIEFQSWMRALTDPGQSYQAVEKIIGQLERFVEVAQQTGKMPPREAAAPAPAPQGRGRAGRDDYPAPKSEAEYNALPSGAMFLDPNGALRRKP